jgi:hypothetical protein
MGREFYRLRTGEINYHNARNQDIHVAQRGYELTPAHATHSTASSEENNGKRNAALVRMNHELMALSLPRALVYGLVVDVARRG